MTCSSVGQTIVGNVQKKKEGKPQDQKGTKKFPSIFFDKLKTCQKPADPKSVLWKQVKTKYAAIFRWTLSIQPPIYTSTLLSITADFLQNQNYLSLDVDTDKYRSCMCNTLLQETVEPSMDILTWSSKSSQL